MPASHLEATEAAALDRQERHRGLEVWSSGHGHACAMEVKFKVTKTHTAFLTSSGEILKMR